MEAGAIRKGEYYCLPWPLAIALWPGKTQGCTACCPGAILTSSWPEKGKTWFHGEANITSLLLTSTFCASTASAHLVLMCLQEVTRICRAVTSQHAYFKHVQYKWVKLPTIYYSKEFSVLCEVLLSCVTIQLRHIQLQQEKSLVLLALWWQMHIKTDFGHSDPHPVSRNENKIVFQ